jgi:3-phenylpropionate/trans-cinnamate dioxygenase ferredoxin reductase subunit
MVQYAGHHGDAERVVWRGDPAEPRWAACWLTGDRLTAILTVDRPRDLLQGRQLIASAQPADASRLADPAIAVKAAVR